MIIDVGGNQYDVDILEGFSISIDRSVKFKSLINGKIYSHDKGINYDKIRSSITIIGSISFLKTILADIKQHKNYITFPSGSSPIFGKSIIASTAYILNSRLSSPIRDKETSLLSLEIITDSFTLTKNQSTFPALRFPYPINRDIDRNYYFTSSDRNGSSVVNVVVDDFNVTQQVETASFRVELCDTELEDLQSFYLYNRANQFLLTTNSILELFHDSTATNVIFTDLAVKRKDFNQWECTLKLSNGVL